jgi:hypothetical protein
MARVVLVLAILGVGIVLFKQRVDNSSSGAAATPTVNLAGVPPQFREILANSPEPAAILRQRGALPGLGAIRRLAGGRSAEPPPPAPFADVGSRRELRKVRADVRRDIRTLNRLSARGGASTAEAERALAEVYSAPVLAALGADGRRAFAERLAGHTQIAQRIKVLDFEGVFVSGRRALAQVVYRLSIRAPSGRFVARSPETWTVTLVREGGRWRFVRGFEAD